MLKEILIIFIVLLHLLRVRYSDSRLWVGDACLSSERKSHLHVGRRWRWRWWRWSVLLLDEGKQTLEVCELKSWCRFDRGVKNRVFLFTELVFFSFKLFFCSSSADVLLFSFIIKRRLELLFCLTQIFHSSLKFLCSCWLKLKMTEDFYSLNSVKSCVCDSVQMNEWIKKTDSFSIFVLYWLQGFFLVFESEASLNWNMNQQLFTVQAVNKWLIKTNR